MAYFVSVEQHVAPEALSMYLDGAREDHQASASRHPGRIQSRIFQSIDDPAHVLALGEWATLADYERFLATPNIQAYVVNATPPARIEPLNRLRQYAHVGHSPAVIACAIVQFPEASAPLLTQSVLEFGRRSIEPSDGLAMHKVFVMPERGQAILDVHTWRSLAHLERFRAASHGYLDAGLRALGATIQRFSGSLVAEYSRPRVNL